MFYVRIVLRPVVSSNLRAVGYDRDSETLVVEFRNGRTYSYEGVPFDEYAGLMNASSHGRYFWRHIRRRYPTSRV